MFSPARSALGSATPSTADSRSPGIERCRIRFWMEMEGCRERLDQIAGPQMVVDERPPAQHDAIAALRGLDRDQRAIDRQSARHRDIMQPMPAKPSVPVVVVSEHMDQLERQHIGRLVRAGALRAASGEQTGVIVDVRSLARVGDRSRPRSI